ncbi:MAG: hypothetical protein QM503_15670 [Bacteroidota bacterium]
MKNVMRLFVFVFTIIVFTAQGQDYILKLNVGINKLQYKNISIINDTVIFVSVSDSVDSVTSIDDVYGIHFYEDMSDELLLLSFQIDTIDCVIDSISNKEIYYRDVNRLLHIIEINDVFCILFDKNNSTTKIESFYSQFINTQKWNYANNPKLIKNDGKVINISKEVTLINDSIKIRIVQKGQKNTDTYALVQTLSSYVNKEPADRQKEVSFKEYILSKEDVLKRVRINQFVNDKIIFSFLGKSRSTILEQNKKSIAGIFFHDYNAKKVKKPPVVKQPKIAKKLTDKKYTFDINAGFGYMLNSERAFSLPNENDEYLNKLRKGFSFDANLRLFITKGFGVGIRYNYFHTSNSMENTLSENINIMFVGGTIFHNLPIMGDKGIFNVDLSIGFLRKTDDFEINNKQYSLTGSAPGVYVSAGLEYFVMKNITVGFSLGLLGGSLEKTNVNSTYDLIMDKPDSLNRFDGMVKIKVYF